LSLLVEVSQDSNHWLGSFGPLVIVFWTRDVDPEVCKRMAVYGRKLAERQRGGAIAVLSIASPTLQGPPSAAARRALATLVQDTGNCVSRIAVLREGRGFIVSIVSSVFLGIQMLVRPQHGYRFFNELGEAIRWVSEELDEFRSGAIRYEVTRMAIEHQSKRIINHWLHNNKSAPEMLRD
jgi:hypothetical protein